MKEANLLPATLLAAGGPGAVLLFKIAAVLSVLAMVTLLGQRYPALWRGLKFSNVLLAIIVLSNSVQILLGT